MIILRKKRILLIVFFLFISVFACMYANEKINQTIQTVATPVNNKVVVLDAGHGKPDEGADLLH